MEPFVDTCLRCGISFQGVCADFDNGRYSALLASCDFGPADVVGMIEFCDGSRSAVPAEGDYGLVDVIDVHDDIYQAR